MTFVPEDGTGLPNANSLVDVAYADDYHACRGNDDWAALTLEQKQFALIKGSDYLNNHRYEPCRKTSTQRLDFPAYFGYISYEYDTSEMPGPILEACCLLALYSLNSSLYENTTATNGIVSEEKELAVMKKKVEYRHPNSVKSQSLMLRFGDVEMLIKPYLKKSGSRLVL